MQKLREKLCCSKKSIVSDGGVTRVVWDSSDGALPSAVLTPSQGGTFFFQGGIFFQGGRFLLRPARGGKTPPRGGCGEPCNLNH